MEFIFTSSLKILTLPDKNRIKILTKQNGKLGAIEINR